MNSEDTFYRFHSHGTPEFSAINAWSAPWGETFSKDGSRYECRNCDGAGCDECDGGWIDADPGYSACWTGTELVDYIDQHVCGNPGPGIVIEFAGQQVGTGFDGEPLVIPDQIIRTLTWQELRAEVAR